MEFYAYKPQEDYTTESIKELLYKNGLNKAQVESNTAKVMTKILFGEEGINTVDEVKNKCAEIITNCQKSVDEICRNYRDYKEKIDKIGDLILAVKDSTEEYGEIKDQKFKDAICMYATLLTIQRKCGISDPDGASYMVYAALGGQAARNIITSSGAQVVEKKTSLGRL